MIKAILFDYGGVYGGEGFSTLLKRLAKISGKSYETVFKLGFSEICIKDGFVTGKVDEEFFWNKILKKLGIPDNSVNINELREYMYEHFRPRPYMERLVDSLRSSYKVGLLSDQTLWLDELDRRHNIYSHFDYLFISYKIGLSKHDPEIFDHVCNEIKVDPSSVFFIDDNEDNIELARKKGIIGHVYKNYNSLISEMKKLGIIKDKTPKKKIPLEQAIRPYIRNLENVLEIREPSPTLYLDGVQYRLRLLKKFISRIQERYNFEIFEDS